MIVKTLLLMLRLRLHHDGGPKKWIRGGNLDRGGIVLQQSDGRVTLLLLRRLKFQVMIQLTFRNRRDGMMELLLTVALSGVGWRKENFHDCCECVCEICLSFFFFLVFVCFFFCSY